jgi:hypothetical protein
MLDHDPAGIVELSRFYEIRSALFLNIIADRTIFL